MNKKLPAYLFFGLAFFSSALLASTLSENDYPGRLMDIFHFLWLIVMALLTGFGYLYLLRKQKNIAPVLVFSHFFLIVAGAYFSYNPHEFPPLQGITFSVGPFLTFAGLLAFIVCIVKAVRTHAGS